uniref:transmembrane protein 134 isoform X1 n=1 Tax=Jaculus jaculus TaxID=51337 RepID=UPI001E1B1756|nr:transmembrane protein 134 isoform X1 [Jaculus jaculus]
MSAARPQFSIDDAFELTLEDAGPGPEASGVSRFGPLHFERRARFEVADEDKQSQLRYQNLENDEDGVQASPESDGRVNTSSQWSFSTISSTAQHSYTCCRCLQRHLLRARLPAPGPRRATEASSSSICLTLRSELWLSSDTGDPRSLATTPHPWGALLTCAWLHSLTSQEKALPGVTPSPIRNFAQKDWGMQD